MGRLGRPRKSMEPRKPCGRLVQPKPKRVVDKDEKPEVEIPPTPEVMARRRALLGSEDRDGELECPITLLGRRIDRDQVQAARKAKAAYARFAVAILPPRVVVGSLRDYVQGSGSGPSLPTEAIDQYRSEYELMRRAVLSEVRWRFRLSPDKSGPVSRQAWREVHRLMQGHLPRNLTALRYGLDAIVLHYDLAGENNEGDQEESRREAA